MCFSFFCIFPRPDSSSFVLLFLVASTSRLSLALNQTTKAIIWRIFLSAPFISRLDLDCRFLFSALFPFLIDLEKGFSSLYNLSILGLMRSGCILDQVIFRAVSLATLFSTRQMAPSRSGQSSQSSPFRGTRCDRRSLRPVRRWRLRPEAEGSVDRPSRRASADRRQQSWHPV